MVGWCWCWLLSLLLVARIFAASSLLRCYGGLPAMTERFDTIHLHTITRLSAFDFSRVRSARGAGVSVANAEPSQKTSEAR